MSRRRAVALALGLAVLCLLGFLAFEPTPAAPVRAHAAAEAGGPVRPEVAPVPTPVAVDGASVSCELSDPAGFAVLVEMDGHERLVDLPVAVDGAWIRFTPRQAVAAGWLHVDGFEPKVIAWLDGACIDLVRLEQPARGWVVGELVGAVDGVEYTVVTPRWGSTTTDGTFRAPVPAGVPSTISVAATFGQVRAEQVHEAITVGADEERSLMLDAPVLPPLGWSLMEVEDGLRVMALVADGPAAQAGLEVGDRVQLVDDAVAADLVGDEITWIDEALALEVWRDGEVLALQVTP